MSELWTALAALGALALAVLATWILLDEASHLN